MEFRCCCEWYGVREQLPSVDVGFTASEGSGMLLSENVMTCLSHLSVPSNSIPLKHMQYSGRMLLRTEEKIYRIFCYWACRLMVFLAEHVSLDLLCTTLRALLAT